MGPYPVQSLKWCNRAIKPYEALDLDPTMTPLALPPPTFVLSRRHQTAAAFGRPSSPRRFIFASAHATKIVLPSPAAPTSLGQLHTLRRIGGPAGHSFLNAKVPHRRPVSHRTSCFRLIHRWRMKLIQSRHYPKVSDHGKTRCYRVRDCGKYPSRILDV